jgi:2-oxoglutarate dehydrogenase E1 component
LAPLGRNEVPATSFLPALSGIGGAGAVSDKVIDDHLAVQAIIRSYQVTKKSTADAPPNHRHLLHSYFFETKERVPKIIPSL